jgi:hypothetical protein
MITVVICFVYNKIIRLYTAQISLNRNLERFVSQA